MRRGSGFAPAAAALLLAALLPGAAAGQEARSIYRVDQANLGSCYDADLSRMLEAHVYAYLQAGMLDVVIPDPPPGIRQRERIILLGDAISDDFPAAAGFLLTSEALGRNVLLAFDATQRDASGHLACYVYLPGDGTCINLQMIREGYARVDRGSPPFQFLQEFAFYEQKARDRRRGIWN